MQQKREITHELLDILCCPICRSKMRNLTINLECESVECGVKFPIINATPVLINEKFSIYTIDDLILLSKENGEHEEIQSLKGGIKKLIPSISINIPAKNNYERISKALLEKSSYARVLVVGGGTIGQGMELLLDNPALKLVETDVFFSPRTSLICDAHDLPFENGSFDGVIVQAVLEHVVDPVRCCDEIHRVLKKNGVVYAETPFMQQVHGRQFDFSRFTHLGHRRLFRKFEEVDSGVACGPGMALAWSYQHFLLSFSESKYIRAMLGAFSSLTSFYLKYFDHYLINKRGALDAASGYYFMGRKSDVVLSDKDLVKLYRGAK